MFENSGMTCKHRHITMQKENARTRALGVAVVNPSQACLEREVLGVPEVDVSAAVLVD